METCNFKGVIPARKKNSRKGISEKIVETKHAVMENYLDFYDMHDYLKLKVRFAKMKLVMVLKEILRNRRTTN